MTRLFLLLAVAPALIGGAAAGGELDLLQSRFKLGTSLASTQAVAQANCARIATTTYSAEQAAPYKSQVQVDCLGYKLLGKDRKIELLVNEGRLGFYWVLIDKGELAPMRRRLEAKFGRPLCEKTAYVIFKGERVALRSEPAEILVGVPADVRAITGGCS